MIELRGITKKYGKTIAANDINFFINKGDIVGLLGPNGAGKTTIMNMITGFIKPTSGQIIINGYDIKKDFKKAKKSIGYMPENVPLYNELRVMEFINYMADLKNIGKYGREYKKNKKQEIEKIIEKTNLEPVKNKLIKNISRGYKQRVELAGALVGNPEILILDEPTVGLDPKQIVQIRELIKSLAKDHTIIISSHILSEISQICDKVIILNKGKIIANSDTKSLEEKLKPENKISIIIEDTENNIEEAIKNIENIEKFKMIKDNEDGTKEYEITAKENNDIRKQLFKECAKQKITIFEMKKKEITLEDAFIKLVSSEEMEENK